MKTLKKTNKLSTEETMISLSCEIQCSDMTGCKALQCLCYTASGNDSKETEEIIF